MACFNNNGKCTCEGNVRYMGNSDMSRVVFDGGSKETLNWAEISVPEILTIPEQKPDIEEVSQVYTEAKINCVDFITTPFAYKSYDLLVNTADIPTIDITGITTSVGTIVGVLDQILALVTGNPLLQPLLGVLQPLLDAVQGLLNSLTLALAALTAAVNNLNALTALPTAAASIVCEALSAVQEALEALLQVVESIIPTVNAVLATLPTNIPLISTLITAVEALLTGLQPTITQIVTEINTLIAEIVAVDFCEVTKAFELIPNAEGTCLTGRKLIIEGELDEKIVYTANVTAQSVHSADYKVQFLAFIIPYAKFENLTYEEGIEVYDPETGLTKTINGYRYNHRNPITIDMCEEFCVTPYIEDIYACALDERKIFKNITVFLKAKATPIC